MIQPLFIFSDWVLVLLRITLGFMILARGVPKLTRAPDFLEHFREAGFKKPLPWIFFAGILETFGGLFLLAGFLTQPAALLLALQFFVIIAWVKVRRGEKFELDLLMFVCLLSLAALGGGFWSVDEALRIILY